MSQLAGIQGLQLEITQSLVQEVVIELQQFHEGQQRILDDGYESRYNAVCCGRRFGKTAMLINLAISYSCASFVIPESDNVVVSGRVGIFTPSYKQGIEIWDQLVEKLEPVLAWKNKSERRMALITGGLIDLWHIEGNTLAGRGRKYHLALLDEAAFTRAPVMLRDVWPRAIRPTLMDYAGRAWVFSTPNGVDDENFFYAICHDEKLGFKVHTAPTSANPHIPRDEIEEFRLQSDPRTWRQEGLAEFVDFGGDAYLDYRKLLVDTGAKDIDGQVIYEAVDPPERCDVVFVVSDTGIKGGADHDGHGFVYVGFKRAASPKQQHKAWILDWELLSVKGAFFERELPRIMSRALQLATEVKARMGFAGIYMEEKALGDLIVQKSRAGTLVVEGHTGQPYCKVIGIDSKLTAEGKEVRAQMVSQYHYMGLCKITRYAYDKTMEFKQVTRNHLIAQISKFFLGDKEAHKRPDDLLDCYCYLLAICFGNNKGI